MKCRSKRSILLTTHSMEEADILCNRIGIITQGSLRCVGKNSELKNKYGSGYNLTIHLKKDKEEAMEATAKKTVEYVNKTFKTTSYEQFNNNIRFKILKEKSTIGSIFKALSSHKHQLGVEDWEISQPSLYDVFLKVTEEEHDLVAL